MKNFRKLNRQLNRQLLDAVTQEKVDIKTVKRLIQDGADVDAVDSRGDSALHIAARKNYPKLIELLIEAGADLNKPNLRKDRPLGNAISRGHNEVALQLIRAGANPDIIVEKIDTLIILDKGQPVERSKDLIWDSENEWYFKKLSALMYAINEKNVVLALALINANADVKKIDALGNSALHFAVSQNLHELVGPLIKAGANIDLFNEKDESPMSIAENMQNQELKEALIKISEQKEAEHNQPKARKKTVNKRSKSPTSITDSINSGDSEKNPKKKTLNKKHKSGTKANQTLKNEIQGLSINLNVEKESVNEPVSKEAMNAMLVEAVDKGDINKISELITQGADVNHKENTVPILNRAIATGNLEVVSLLISVNADINRVNVLGYSPLMFAIIQGKREIASKLIDSGADVKAVNSDGKSAFDFAKETKNIDLINLFIKKEDKLTINTTIAPDFARKSVNEPVSKEAMNAMLVEAVDKGDINKVLELINKGADINHRDAKGHTPLMHAITLCNKGLALELIEAGADVDILAEETGDSALLFALKHHNNPSKENKNLTKEERLEIVKALVDKGSDVNIVNELSQSPLSLVGILEVQKGKDEIFTAISELLKEKGAYLNGRYTDLMRAIVSYNRKEALEIINSDTELRIDYKNRKGETALTLAVEYGYADVAEKLIQKGITSEIINQQDSSGNTSLHYAKTSSVYSMLIEAGADPKIKNNNGEVAYDRLSWMSRFSVWINDIYKEYFKPKAGNNILNKNSNSNGAKNISLNDVKLNFINERKNSFDNTISTTAINTQKEDGVTDPKINITEPAMKDLSGKNGLEEQEKHVDIERQ